MKMQESTLVLKCTMVDFIKYSFLLALCILLKLGTCKTKVAIVAKYIFGDYIQQMHSLYLW